MELPVEAKEDPEDPDALFGASEAADLAELLLPVLAAGSDPSAWRSDPLLDFSPPFEVCHVDRVTMPTRGLECGTASMGEAARDWLVFSIGEPCLRRTNIFPSFGDFHRCA